MSFLIAPCDLVDRLGEGQAYVANHDDSDTDVLQEQQQLLLDARDRIVMLERIVDRYGDRIGMASCPDSKMQYVIDIALASAGRPFAR